MCRRGPVQPISGAKRTLGRSTALLFTCLAALALMLPRLCPAQTINPVQSDETCPDGMPRINWQYPTTGGIPGNATAAVCNGQPCVALPASACLRTVEVPGPLNVPDLPRVSDPPDPSKIRPFAGSSTAPLPGGQKPTSATPGGSIKVPVSLCEAGKGWDFEDIQDNNT